MLTFKRKLKSWKQVEFYFSIILGSSRDKLGFFLCFFFPLLSLIPCYFFVLCLWMYLSSYMPQCLSVQKTICRSLLSPSIMWIQGWKSGYHAWREALYRLSHLTRLMLFTTWVCVPQYRHALPFYEHLWCYFFYFSEIRLLSKKDRKTSRLLVSEISHNLPWLLFLYYHSDKRYIWAVMFMWVAYYLVNYLCTSSILLWLLNEQAELESS